MDIVDIDMANPRWILRIANNYFPAIREDNFTNLFKLSVNKVAQLLSNETKARKVRDFLMFLFHLKHYLPIRTACIFFHIENSRYEKIINTQIDLFCEKFKNDYFDLERRLINGPAEGFAETYTVVDSTEVLIEAYKRKSFSGKKNNFTLKYQVVVSCTSGEILHIFGPELGSIHDAQIYRNSCIGDFFEGLDEYCLGDKGYVGCLRVTHPHKRKRHALTRQKVPLTPQQQDYNRRLAHFRIVIENVNSSLKNWSILSTVYRGDLEKHSKIFTCCAILTNMSAEH
jgi:hypothetical protein